MNLFLCLMTSGLYITEDLRDELLEEAFLMIDDNASSHRIKTDVCEGVITSSFKTVVMGHFGGVLFDAKIEMGWRTFHVRYLVNPDMRHRQERCRWVDHRENASTNLN